MFKTPKVQKFTPPILARVTDTIDPETKQQMVVLDQDETYWWVHANTKGLDKLKAAGKFEVGKNIRVKSIERHRDGFLVKEVKAA